ncbi:MAG: ATP-binding cassette domain-containing protein [Coriobacteriia bacterium]|nr:ATP-binding cassette domain-containing protein [Coriobacteriia bacterium]
MSGLSVSVRAYLPGFTLDTGWAVTNGFTVLLGYSGAGKSLTLSAIAGTLRPDAGRVVLGGETLFDATAGLWVPPQARMIGYVPQNAQLFPHMSVADNVAYALVRTPRRARAERVSTTLDRLGIGQLAAKLPHELSGGQRQRAALARVIASEPRALLLDEPLSALDLPVRVEMRELLAEVQTELDIPVVMVTHDLYEACSLADTLVVYSGTGVVQVGTARELIGDPATPEIRRLLHAAEVPDSVFDRKGRGQKSERVIPFTRKERVA